MALIVWGPDLEVGIGIIDRQHKGLVEIVNRLNDAMAAGKGRTVLAGTLSELISYTKTHFATEERLMREHAYPSQSSHQFEHAKLLKTVHEFHTKFDSGNANLSVALLNFLCEWLTQHIQQSDKKLGQALREKGVV